MRAAATRSASGFVLDEYASDSICACARITYRVAGSSRRVPRATSMTLANTGRREGFSIQGAPSRQTQRLGSVIADYGRYESTVRQVSLFFASFFTGETLDGLGLQICTHAPEYLANSSCMASPRHLFDPYQFSSIYAPTCTPSYPLCNS